MEKKSKETATGADLDTITVVEVVPGRSGTLPDLTFIMSEEPSQTTTTLTEFLVETIRQGRSLRDDGNRKVIDLAEAGLKLQTETCSSTLKIG
jgi:hypothetical protein